MGRDANNFSFEIIMRKLGNPLISLAAPLLILLTLLGSIQREGNDWINSLPAFVFGGGLIITGLSRRTTRRSMLLTQLRKKKDI